MQKTLNENNANGAGNFSDTELHAALDAYGIQAETVAPYKQNGVFASIFLARCKDSSYLIRIRSAQAAAEEIRFARDWALAVEREVPVPVPLTCDPIPRINGRFVEVQPYLPHEHGNGGAVGPQAWIRIGEWLGRMHRLGQSLAERAPRDLAYGNYPSAARIDEFFRQARSSAEGQYRELFDRSQRLWLETSQALSTFKDSLPVGVVHGDMHFWNVLYTNGMPSAVIDLDFLQRGVLLCDVAYACGWLSHWQKNSGPEWHGILDRYLDAYGRGRGTALSDVEHRALPWARIQSCLFFFIQVASIDWKRTKDQMADLSNAEELYSEVTSGLRQR